MERPISHRNHSVKDFSRGEPVIISGHQRDVIFRTMIMYKKIAEDQNTEMKKTGEAQAGPIVSRDRGWITAGANEIISKMHTHK